MECAKVVEEGRAADLQYDKGISYVHCVDVLI
jgi:hypothetical protein